MAAVLFSVLVIYDIIKNGTNNNWFFSLLFLLVSLLYAYLNAKNFNGFLFILAIPLMVFTKNRFLYDTYSAFKLLMAFIMGISIIVYILVVFLNVPIPYNVIEPLNEDKNEVFLHYPFLITNTLYGIVIPRFFCVFDEPGVVGTFCGIILAAEKFNFKNKINFVFLLGGILSVSFFFFIICGLYIIINAKIKYKVLVALVVLVFYFLFSSNEVINDLVFQRFLIEDGAIAGDNRSTQSFDNFYSSFRHSSDYLWGLGAGTGAVLNEGGSSYKQIIVDFGIIFFSFYMIVFLFLCRFNKMKKKDAIMMILVVIGVMYQRPFMGQICWVFMLYSSCVITGIKDNCITERVNINQRIVQ